jgi:hypothetical protein
MKLIAAAPPPSHMRKRRLFHPFLNRLSNHQPPIYLACGPYRVNVAAPGTYSFPLEVFETYEVRTYPTAVPFTVDFDDGYTGGGSTYGVASGAVLLASGHFTPPPDDILRLRLQCWAQNVGDGKKETCVQIVVVPRE